MANYIYNGDQEKALEWLQSYNALIEEIKAPNEHQHAFLLGFKSSLYLREGMEDKALEIADQGLDYLKVFFSFFFFLFLSLFFSYLNLQFSSIRILSTVECHIILYLSKKFLMFI